MSAGTEQRGGVRCYTKAPYTYLTQHRQPTHQAQNQGPNDILIRLCPNTGCRRNRGGSRLWSQSTSIPGGLHPNVGFSLSPSLPLPLREAVLTDNNNRYQLGQAIGGFLIPPFSELFGRRLPYLISCAAFCLASLLTGLIHDPAAVYAGRFAAGLASAVPSVVIAGSVEDMFNTKRRVWIIVLWNAGTTVGLCFGPVYAAYISQAVGWRWIFHSAAAVTAVLFLAMFGIRESRPSILLGAIVKKIQRERTTVRELAWHNPDEARDWRALVRISVLRPGKILLTEPLVVMVALISASSWGMIYLFTESLTVVYVSLGFTKTQASLPFLAIAVGVVFTFLPRLWDMKVVRDRQRKQIPIQP